MVVSGIINLIDNCFIINISKKYCSPHYAWECEMCKHTPNSTPRKNKYCSSYICYKGEGEVSCVFYEVQLVQEICKVHTGVVRCISIDWISLSPAYLYTT